MAFTGNLSGKRLCDAAEERRNVISEAVPVTSGFSNVNSFAVPQGAEAARGWVLVLRDDLNGLDLNARHTLTFNCDSAPVPTSITWQNLIIAREPSTVDTALASNAPETVCLVEVADVRHLLKNPSFAPAINTQYNVRSLTAGVTYTADSLSGGVTTWTWTTMITDIWNTMSAIIGSFPGLPFTPDGTPEGWNFHGASAWDALTAVLRRIGCAINADLTVPAAAQFSIVRTGTADAALTAALAAADLANRKIHDAEYQTVVRGLLPRGCRVFFHQQRVNGSVFLAASTQWGSTPLHSIDVAVADITNTENVYTPIYDDLAAVYDAADTLTNEAALTSRATERAADYFRMLTDGGGARLWKRYSGLLDIIPGSTLKGVRWVAQGDVPGSEVGCWTEIINHPFLGLRINDAAEWHLVHDDANQPGRFTAWPVPGVGPDFYSIINFYNTVNFFETVNFNEVSNFYQTVNFYSTTIFNQYFTWQPITVTDPTTNIVLDPGTDPKLRFVTGPFVWVTEQQLGSLALPEIQKVWVENAAGGTFSLVMTSADGTQTATVSGLAWNILAATLQTALNAGAATFTVPYTVAVAGLGTLASPWIVTFSGAAPYKLLFPLYNVLTGPPLTVTYPGISDGVDGRILTIENAGPGLVVLDDAYAAGAATAYAAGQGIFLPLQVPYTIWPDCSLMLEYDAYGDGLHGGWRPMNPTIGTTHTAGFAGPWCYATTGIRFLSGFTYTDNSDGTVDVTVNFPDAPPPCLASNEVSGTTTTSADGTFTAGTNKLTIPSDGTYLLFGRLSTHVTNTSGSTVVQATGRLMLNATQLQIGAMFHTFSDKEAAGSVTFVAVKTFLVVGDVISVECQIFKNGTADFDYDLSYVQICGSGGS